MRGATILLLLSFLLSSAHAIECTFRGGADLSEASAWRPSVPTVNDTAIFKKLNVSFVGQSLNVANVKMIRSTLVLTEGTIFVVGFNTTVDKLSSLMVLSQSVLNSDGLISLGMATVKNATIHSRIISHLGSNFVIHNESKISGDYLEISEDSRLGLGLKQPNNINDGSTTRLRLYIDIKCYGQLVVGSSGVRNGPFVILSDRHRDIEMFSGSRWFLDAPVEMKDFSLTASKMGIQLGSSWPGFLKAYVFTLSSISLEDCKITRAQTASISNVTFILTGNGPSYIYNVRLADVYLPGEVRPSIIAQNHTFYMGNFTQGDSTQSWRLLSCSTNCTINSYDNVVFDEIRVTDSVLAGTGIIHAKITAEGITTLSGTPTLIFRNESTMDTMFVNASAKINMATVKRKEQLTVNKITGTGSITSTAVLKYNAAYDTTETLDLASVNLQVLALNYLTKIIFSTRSTVQIGTLYVSLDDGTDYINYNNTVILSAPNGNVQVNKTGLIGDEAECFVAEGSNKGKRFEVTVPIPTVSSPVTLERWEGLMDRYVTVSIDPLPSCFTLESWTVSQNGSVQTRTAYGLRDTITLDNTDGCSYVTVTVKANIALVYTETIVNNTAAATILTVVPADFTGFKPSFDQLVYTHTEENYTISWPQSFVEGSVVCGQKPSKISLLGKLYDVASGSAMIKVPKCIEQDLEPQLVYALGSNLYNSDSISMPVSWRHDPTPASKPNITTIFERYYLVLVLSFPDDATCDCNDIPKIEVKQGTEDYYEVVNSQRQYARSVYIVPQNMTYTYHTKCKSQKTFSVERTLSVYVTVPTTSSSTTTRTTEATVESSGMRSAFSVLLLVSAIMFLF